METGHERASEVIHKDIYVDDCISGMTISRRFVLSLKDGESILAGGMRWFSKKDYLHLNIGNFNYSKTLRGRKARSDLDVVPEKLTRRDCVSKVSEIFDPLGWVDPIIGGMKIDMHELVSRKLNWDDQIPDDLKTIWVQNFETILELRHVTFNRAIVHHNAKSLEMHIGQLICVAIYARFLLSDEGHSCQLVFARTKLVPKGTSVPRAELLAATLNATTGHVVKYISVNISKNQ